MKDSILDELFTGNWKTPLEVKFPEGTEDIREKESDIHAKVEELLGENSPLLDEMLAERFSYEAHLQNQSFKIGVKLGSRFALACLGEDKS